MKPVYSYDWYALIVIGHDIHDVIMLLLYNTTLHHIPPPPPPPPPAHTHTHTVRTYNLSCSLLCVTFPYVKNGQRFCTLVHVYTTHKFIVHCVGRSKAQRMLIIWLKVLYRYYCMFSSVLGACNHVTWPYMIAIQPKAVSFKIHEQI